MNQATIGRRTYQVAGRFAELQPRQLTAIVGLLHSGRAVVEVRLRILLVLLGVRRRPWLAFRLWFRVSDEQRFELLKLTDFAFRDPKLYEQRLPMLRVWPWKLYGPASNFANLTFAEFIDSEAHFSAYGRSRAEADLNRLVAALYRPANGKGRLPFDAATIAQRVRLVARLPLATRLAVRMWYTSCRQAWARKYEGTLFAAPEDAGPAKASDPRTVWNEVLAESAGSPDRYELMGQQPLPNMLYHLDRGIRRRRAEQEALKASSR